MWLRVAGATCSKMGCGVSGKYVDAVQSVHPEYWEIRPGRLGYKRLGNDTGA